ncbi:LPD1 domain-containing protein [Paenibacillus sp. Y412MC10]|uniref:LPD1 domain-containing protein n=1 Tax=Geobacillus sp. (strain Y412MC10) TaxID=481743 RepID=UPI0011AB8497|nr:LPD1 domain-containing protein [Paenibacillus sp. Y412MC10]
MNGQRIYTLKKDEVLRKQFEYYGLSSLISEVNFSVDKSETNGELMKKFESSIKRKIKRVYFAKSLAEKLRFIEELSFGPNRVEVELLNHFDNESMETVLKLLCDGAKVNVKREFYEPLLPAKLTITKGTEVTEAYTFLNNELSLKYHHQRWGLKRNSKRIGYFKFVDCLRLFAEIISFNSLCQFAESQAEYVRYKIAEYYSDKSVNESKAVLPEEPDFALIIKQGIAQYHMPFVEEEEAVDKTFSFDVYSLQKDAGGIPLILKFKEGKDIIVPRLMRTISYVKDKVNRMLEEHSTYAKVFQDKKHVNQKVKKVMERNKFLDMYGKIELDNDVDLARFAALEKEFVELRKKVYVPTQKDHDFRVRKLGRHRTAGVYYPFFKATIIDIQHPDSYAHELAHQIDYTFDGNSMLSEKMSFLRIVQMYEKLVNDLVSKLPAGDPFIAVWEGKTKYNRSYYLEPTEVFARSFELYLSVCKGIESSFLKEKYDSPIYPKSSSYLEAIQIYFDELFASYVPDAEEKPASSFKLVPAVASSTSKVETREYKQSTNGQLLLF